MDIPHKLTSFAAAEGAAWATTLATILVGLSVGGVAFALHVAIDLVLSSARYRRIRAALTSRRKRAPRPWGTMARR
jgi:hypothetical protein